ncbi:MAG TPA: restriction endonuclease subunit S [Segetibacter sp.]|jgi:type I restriction enzyme S subunit
MSSNFNQTEVGKIPAIWDLKKIGEIDIVIGDGNYSSKYPKENEFRNQGVPFISAVNLKGREISKKGLRFITKSQHKELKKGHLKTDDVLVVVRGNGVGQVALVPAEYEDANINAQLAFLRSGKTINGKFLYYLLSTNEYLTYIRKFVSGSAQPQLPIKSLKEVKISIPPLQTQKTIATILSTLDDKIELNRQTAQTLEAIAQAIFKEWFVDFNYPGATGEMQESELGGIPKGWRVGKLGEVVEVNPKLRIRKGNVAKYVEMKDLSETSLSINRFIEREFTSGSKFQNGDTLFARITPCLENGKTGYVDSLMMMKLAGVLLNLSF